MRDKIDGTIHNIKNAFPPNLAPYPEWERCKSVEDFTRNFGTDFFPEFWTAMYDDFEVTSFLLPFVMEYFLTVTKPEDISAAADYFIGRLDPIAQKETQMDYFVEKLFTSLTREQRKTVCEWLTVMEKRYILYNLEGAREYWCSPQA